MDRNVKILPLLKDTNVSGKRVFLRVDLNVPIENGVVTNTAKIKACIPTIKYILEQGGSILLVSHLGRPKEGVADRAFSLKILMPYLTQEFGNKIEFRANWLDSVSNDNDPKIPNSTNSNSTTTSVVPIVLCENVRFLQGEVENDTNLAKKMASICDVFVMDAFASAHRAHASTEGIAHFVQSKAAGFLLEQEVNALNNALAKPKHPVVAIVGGSKVSTKIAVLENVIPKVDYLILGGGIANTFLLAQEFNVGSSLVEKDLTNVAIKLLSKAKQSKTKILLPTDVVVAKEMSTTTPITKTLNANEINDSDKIFDIGPQTIKEYVEIIKNAATILWNGPVGVFEEIKFANGTMALAHAIAANTQAFSIAGGGDTIAAIDKFAVSAKISYISTGGGAFLEFIEGKELPGIKALEQPERNNQSVITRA